MVRSMQDLERWLMMWNTASSINRRSSHSSTAAPTTAPTPTSSTRPSTTRPVNRSPWSITSPRRSSGTPSRWAGCRCRLSQSWTPIRSSRISETFSSSASLRWSIHGHRERTGCLTPTSIHRDIRAATSNAQSIVMRRTLPRPSWTLSERRSARAHIVLDG